MQFKEADSVVIPLPLNIPEAPGWFTPVIQEESYYIYSIPYSSEWKTQDISKSLIVFDLMIIWLTVLIVTYVLETVIMFTKTNPLNGLCSLLGETFSHYFSILFGQFNPNSNNNLIRIYQSFLLLMSLCLFNATFNTSTIIGETIGKVDTLQDVVTQDKIPVFLEGLSLFELFQIGITQDHREVYKLAERKQTMQAFGLSPTELFEALSPKHAILVSAKVGDSGTILPSALGNNHFEKFYRSKKPYHRGLLAYIVNPKNNIDEIKRRLGNL